MQGKQTQTGSRTDADDAGQRPREPTEEWVSLLWSYYVALLWVLAMAQLISEPWSAPWQPGFHKARIFHRSNEINISPSTSIYRWHSLVELLLGWDADRKVRVKRGSWRARALLTQVAAVVKRLLGNDVMHSEWHKNTYLSRPQGHTGAAICALLPCWSSLRRKGRHTAETQKQRKKPLHTQLENYRHPC